MLVIKGNKDTLRNTLINMATLGGHGGLHSGSEYDADVPDEVHGHVGPLLAEGSLEGLIFGILVDIDPLLKISPYKIV